MTITSDAIVLPTDTSPMNAGDHFGNVAQLYSDVRPTYPPQLYRRISKLCPANDCAIDLATGNGQAAYSLARYFTQVEAVDHSARMIEQAKQAPNIHYHVAPAEHTNLPDETADLVTVATAMHWLNKEAFFKEVFRLLKPNGIFAAWGYMDVDITPELDAIVNGFAHETLKDYWLSDMPYLWGGYNNPFPFEVIEMPPMKVEAEWTLAQLTGLVNTWAAVDYYKTNHNGENPVNYLSMQLQKAWGDAVTRTVTWPLALRVGKKTAESEKLLARFLNPTM